MGRCHQKSFVLIKRTTGQWTELSTEYRVIIAVSPDLRDPSLGSLQSWYQDPGSAPKRDVAGVELGSVP